MARANILTGQAAYGALFAAFDPAARFVTPQVQDLRFAASLSPFPDRASAMLALETAGARNIEELSR
jgi:hypothetical protein